MSNFNESIEKTQTLAITPPRNLAITELDVSARGTPAASRIAVVNTGVALDFPGFLD